MSRRRVTLLITFITLGCFAMCIGGLLVYRHASQQRLIQPARDLALHLGYQPDNLLLEHRICGLFEQGCGWYIHFTTPLTIEQVEQQIPQLSTSRVLAQSLNGHDFISDFIQTNPDTFYANGQDLFDVDMAIPQPRSYEWYWPDDGLYFHIELYETAHTTNVYEFKGKVITDNLMTVFVSYP